MKHCIILSSLLIGLFTPGLYAAAYSGGSGTEADPYQIATKSDLLSLSANTADYTQCFILTADIDLAGQSFSKACIAFDTYRDNQDMDFQGTPFTGVFNGNKHVIRNLTIDGSDENYVGLFGKIGPGGQIRNLGIVNADIEGFFYAGGLAGVNEGGIIVFSYASGSVNTKIAGAGGMVGWNRGGTISDCSSTCTVSGSFSVGGLVGLNSKGKITDCNASGNVRGFNGVGGLVGGNDDNGVISTCFATGQVADSNSGACLGGLVGGNWKGTITSCYATGSVTNNGTNVGGLVGANDGNITGCYATGLVAGSDNIGGLVGANNKAVIKACFWDTQTSKRGDGVGYADKGSVAVTGKTSAQMKMLSTFIEAGWDFADEAANGTEEIWKISDGVGYPAFYTGTWMTLAKCKVTAGKSAGAASISFSGTLNATEADILAAASIIVSLDAEDMTAIQEFPFAVNKAVFKKGKFTAKNSNSALKLDTKTGKMTFTAKNVDLTGLACPIAVMITTGDYKADTAIHEDVVNGAKACPIQLLAGVKNTLSVDKSKFNADSFAVSGTFTLADDYDTLNPMVIMLGTQTFTVDGGKFVNTKGAEICKKVVLSEGQIVDAKFDFVKCTYTISIKNAEIKQNGTLDFDIDCFGVSLKGFTSVTLP